MDVVTEFREFDAGVCRFYFAGFPGFVEAFSGVCEALRHWCEAHFAAFLRLAGFGVACSRVMLTIVSARAPKRLLMVAHTIWLSSR